MAEYIEREAAIDEIDSAFPAAPASEFSKGVAVGVAMARLAICHLPAASVRENVTGEWIYKSGERYKEYTVTCPFCGSSYMDCYDGYINADDFNFCPNCGADMTGGNNG